MTNRIVLLLIASVIGLSVFPVTQSKNDPVSCKITIATGDGPDLPVQVLNQDFENFFNETSTISRRAGVTLTMLTMNNGDLMIWYRQDRRSPKSYVDLDFHVKGVCGPISYWKHEPYVDRSEYAGDDIKSTYKKTMLNSTTVSDQGSPSLFELGKDKPSVFVCRPGRFRPQPVGLLKYIESKRFTTLVFNPDNIKVRLNLEPTMDEFEEGFVMVSNSRLLNLDDMRTHSFLVSHDMWRVKPLLSDGWWYSAQTGYFEGADGDCYYPNPGFYASKSMLTWYCQLDNRLFYNIVLSTMKMALDKTRMEGFARMPIMPVYFTNMYGGFVDYLDTRFSTDGVRFLVKCAKLLDCRQARDTISRLAHFYAKNLDQISISVDGTRGKLISDYIYDSVEKKPVHVSLNHTLCIINYLLEYEDATGDSGYGWLVDELVSALGQSEKRWVKPNGDFWYGYFTTIARFSNDDYAYLTFNDLVEVTQNFELVRNSGSPQIQELLETKRKYLVDSGLMKTRIYASPRVLRESDAMVIDGSSNPH